MTAFFYASVTEVFLRPLRAHAHSLCCVLDIRRDGASMFLNILLVAFLELFLLFFSPEFITFFSRLFCVDARRKLCQTFVHFFYITASAFEEV